MTRRPDVQGLRAVAVGLVVLDHAGVPWLRGGFVGVDVFFVVSGFLITSLLVSEAAASGRVRIGAFYARRARRILPAATVVLVATSLYAAVALSTTRAESVADDALWSTFFLANEHFAATGTDYFAQGQPPSPLQHFWSLSVEEQFYLLWPGLLALAVVLSSSRWRRTLVVVVVVLCLGSFGWGLALQHHSPVEAYFSSPARAWELGLGGLLALLAERLDRMGRGATELLAVAGLATVLASAALLGGTASYQGWQSAAPVLGTAAVLAAGCGNRSLAVATVLRARPVQWLGDISYSLYLWHWPVLVLGAEYAGPSVSPAERAGLVVLSMALAALSYHAVENPFRRTRSVWAGPRRGLLIWPAALGVTMAGVGWSGHLATASEHQRMEESLRYYEAEPETPMRRLTLTDRIAKSLERARDHAPIPLPIENLDHLGDDLWDKKLDCVGNYLATSVPICPLGDLAARRTVVAIGDSHMGMWLPALDVAARLEGFRVVPFVKYSCAPYDVPLAIKEVGGEYTQCAEFRDWVVGRLDELRPVAILLGARGLAKGLSSLSVDELVAAWEGGVTAAVTELKSHAPVVKIFGDIVEQSREPADCLTDRSSTMATCVSGQDDRVRHANAMFRRVAAATSTDYVDVSTLLCVAGRCPMVVGRIATYADNDHVSVTWARAVADELVELLDLPRSPDGEPSR